jgi:hypothetical protein
MGRRRQMEIYESDPMHSASRKMPMVVAIYLGVFGMIMMGIMALSFGPCFIVHWVVERCKK